MNSINHEYKEWDEKNPQLTTCNQNTKNIIQGSTVPQEVDIGKEIIFTYDVSFKVLPQNFTFCQPSFLKFFRACIFLSPNSLFRKVI